ncbi:MAG: HAMP domain-containing protein [Planctomycetes bacterium]|nr:HAMP domain-containing protein [Planctomycetota bacterium]
MSRLSMFWQTFFAFGILIVVALGVLGGVIGSWVERQALLQIEERLKSKAILLRELARGRSVTDLREQVEALRRKIDTRITLIGADGAVLVETDREDLEELDNHLKRPEIQQSRTAPYGVATRYSTTVQKSMMYVATHSPDTSEVAYVRVALPVTEVVADAARLRNLVWITAAGTALLALFVTWILTRRLTQPLQELSDGARAIAAGDYGHKVYIDRKDETGRLAGVFNHMSSQLARQFTQLDEDRQQLRAVLSSMVEGVIAIDGEQDILFANDRAGLMLDFSTTNAAGRKLWEIVRQRAVLDLVQATLRESSESPRNLEFIEAAGKSLMLHVAQLPGESARGAVLVFHDTTELRRLERLRQEFVANVSHELKTPLSVIAACVETLIDGGMDDVENRGRFLQRVLEESHRLHALILDLLSLARIESGDQHWILKPLLVADLVQASIDRHQARARGKKQTLTLDSSAKASVQVMADQEALSEILDNLVDNAVKYTPEGGVIRLNWWPEDGHVNLEVQDTGIGIPESDLPRIFERFYRVDKARSREMGGTGLGLSIVKHLVQAMQGGIRASSTLGQGSTFTVRLPKPD